MFVGLMQSSEGIWTVDIQNPKGGANIKLKILPKR